MAHRNYYYCDGFLQVITVTSYNSTANVDNSLLGDDDVLRDATVDLFLGNRAINIPSNNTIQDRPVLSSERAPHIKKPQWSDIIKIWS
jgi:hypothetical protein